MPAAAKQFHISAAIPFIPRQIMLQIPPIIACQEEKKRRKEEKKAKKRSSETLDAAPAAPETLDLDVAANGGGEGLKRKERKLLLRSISAYLESNGFTRTLAIFQSEAELPTDGGKASILNLEDLFCKFLELSKSSEDATTDWPKEQDSVPGDDSRVKKKDKKKRKPAFDPVGENNAEGTHGIKSTDPENDLPENVLPENDLSENDVNEKQKRKKKSKMSSDSFSGKHELGDKVKSQELVEEKVEELTSLPPTPAVESNPKGSGEKRKKTKRGSVASAGNAEEIDTGEFVEGNKKKTKGLKSLGSDSKTDSELLNSVTVDTSIKDASLNADSKSKGKKKKKDRTISETLHSLESYQVDGGMSNDVGGDTAGHTTTDVLENIDPTKEISEQNIDNLKISKKRKKLALEERVLESENVVESKDPKHTRVEGVEEKKKSGIHQNLDMSLPDSEDLSVSKKQKKEKSNENSSEAVTASFNQQIAVSIEHKDNSGGYDSPKQANGHLANGNLEKESEGLSSKMLNKGKLSAEPTSNAFRRVKLEEVEFVDERLQNNSYWAKGGADSGYGAKAQEILGQVKGRNFRHEKTKKKRGSYRGGQIDLQSHSIKFNYSDEE